MKSHEALHVAVTMRPFGPLIRFEGFGELSPSSLDLFALFLDRVVCPIGNARSRSWETAN
jgi:hypothetical protein